jgi:hypothetical protein
MSKLSLEVVVNRSNLEGVVRVVPMDVIASGRKDRSNDVYTGMHVRNAKQFLVALKACNLGCFDAMKYEVWLSGTCEYEKVYGGVVHTIQTPLELNIGLIGLSMVFQHQQVVDTLMWRGFSAVIRADLETPVKHHWRNGLQGTPRVKGGTLTQFISIYC